MRMRGYHDIGGLASDVVERREHDYALWEKRVDALLMLLSKADIVRVDELRRGIETLGAEAYDQLSYYERWISAITRVLIEKGVISIDELGRKMEALRVRWNDAGETEIKA